MAESLYAIYHVTLRRENVQWLYNAILYNDGNIQLKDWAQRTDNGTIFWMDVAEDMYVCAKTFLSAAIVQFTKDIVRS